MRTGRCFSVVAEEVRRIIDGYNWCPCFCGSSVGTQEEKLYPCVCVCVRVGWHRWLWSEDVINTLGRGISVQDWAPCFGREVIRKKPGATGGGTDTHTYTDRYYLTTFARESQLSLQRGGTHTSLPNFLISTWDRTKSNLGVSDTQSQSGFMCFLRRDGDEVRVQSSTSPHGVCSPCSVGAVVLGVNYGPEQRWVTVVIA